jgi:DNA processing protein
MTVPEHAYAAALAAFDNMTVHRLSALLRRQQPSDAWEVVQGRRPAQGLIAKVLADDGVRRLWAKNARHIVPEQVWERCEGLGLQVVLHGGEGYPALLVDDPLPPPVLFMKGDSSLLAGRRAGIVGTRNATAGGRQSARSLGLGLAAAGVHVVSGLARGVDGCAHQGVLAAEGQGRPIAIVASGLDIVYPREHRDLWSAVGNCGLLISETPPGIGPAPFRVPLRNRIVAALSEVVVVVESRERGGSLITAAEALDRSVPLMAVPGHPGNRAAAGTNALLRDGAAPAMDAGDVLAVLQMEHGRAGGVVPAELRRRPRKEDIAVYLVVRDEPRTIDGVALLAGLSLVEAAMCLARLELAGWVAQADGWFECVGAPLR